jgi:hypothetical protein
MEWIALLLLVGLALMAYLWWLSLKQTNDVLNFFVLMLLNEASYRVRKDGLHFLVSDVKAENAIELSMKVTFMLRKLIGDADSDRMKISVVTKLWELKENTKPHDATSVPSTGN